MIKYLRQLADTVQVEKTYDGNLPSSVPIEIPSHLTTPYDQNIYLKEHLAHRLADDHNWDVHYWIIQDWGGIKNFKKTEKNNQLIVDFKKKLESGKLPFGFFNTISSLSKLASFWEPDKFAIYDSRAIYSLNWLLFRYSNDKRLFPQPIGRNATLGKYNINTLFFLSAISFEFHHNESAYHEYSMRLQNWSEQIFGSRKPYLIEMLLFQAAPNIIVEDIKKNTNVRINCICGADLPEH